MTGVDPRAVEVRSGTSAVQLGSGYVIGPGLVLTAAHVVRAAARQREPIAVRSAADTGENAWIDAARPHLPDDPDLDVAVLEVPWAHAAPLVPVGEVNVDLPLRFRAPAFPRMQRDGARRDLEIIRGMTAPGSAGRRRVLSLDVDSAVPAERDAGWAGASGAPVFFGPLLIGVISSRPAATEARRLEATPITAITADRGLDVLPPAWGGTAVVPASSRLSVAIGPHQQAMIESPFVQRDEWTQRDLRSSSLAPLRARNQVVPFIGREATLAALRDWCFEGDEPLSYAVVSGPAGSGKSRLANQLAREAVDLGWIAGPVHRLVPTPSSVHLHDLGERALLLLDYVDHRADEVADLLDGLLDGLRTGHPRTRLVLLVRNAERFLEGLEREQGGDLRRPAVELHLDSAELAPQERARHYAAAWHAFRDLWGLEVADPPDDGRGVRLDGLSTPLLVHIRALLDVAGDDRSAGGRDAPTEESAPAGDLLRRLVLREDAKFWAPALARHGLDDDTRKVTMAASTFAGADDAEEAVALIRTTEVLRRADGLLVANLVGALRGLYSGSERYLPAVEPDLVGEHLIATRLLAGGLEQRVLAGATSASQRSRMLEVLLRMRGSSDAGVSTAAATALEQVVRTSLPELVEQAVASPDAEPGSDGRALAGRLAAVLGYVQAVDVAAEAAEIAMPQESRLQPLAAALYLQAAAYWEERGDFRRASQLMIDAGMAEITMGHPEAAAGPSEQALGYVTQLPSVNNPLLSKVLSINALVRLGTGNADHAVAFGQRAVAAAERAVVDDPANATQLAESQYMLVLGHLLAGDPTAALATAEDAVATGEAIGALPHGRALAVKAFAHFASGWLLDAIDVAEEALGHLRSVADVPPQELCGVLSFIAMARLGVGDLGAAFAAADEAVRIVDLNSPLTEVLTLNQANVRMAAAIVAAQLDGEMGLELIRDARRTYNGLLAENPDGYGPQVVWARLVEAEILSSLGRDDEAVREASGAFDLASDLYRERPRLFLSLLAVVGVSKAEALAATGRNEQATATLDEIVQQLRTGEPQPVLGHVLQASWTIYQEAGDEQRALDAARDLVAFVDDAAESGVNAFGQQAVGAFASLASSALALDLDDEAADASDRAIATASRLMAEVPGAHAGRIHAFARAVAGHVQRATGRPAVGADHFRRAIVELEALGASKGDAEDVDWLQGELEECLADLGIDALRSVRRPGVDDSQGLAALEVDGVGVRADPAVRADGDARHRVVLGRYRGREIAARPFRPVLVVGPQRSGKTTGVVVPTLLEWDGPALVTSVRTDVVRGTIRTRSRRGDAMVFEPAGRLVSGDAVTSWNPLEDCRRWDDAVGTARSLVEAARTRGNSGIRDEEFWYTAAEQLLQPLLYAAANTGQTMGEVSRWVKARTYAEVQARLMVSPDPQEALAAFAGTRSLAEITMSSVYGTAATVLGAYDSRDVREASRSGFDVQEFFNGEANTLYLCAPPDEQELMAPIFTALVRRVITEAYHRQAAGEKLRPLLVLLDEAGNIARIRDLDTLATTAAGTQVQLVTVFHDLAQMEALYGPAAASSIANNHSALLLLPGNRDPRTANLVRDITGGDIITSLGNRPARRLAAHTALCIYENMAADVIDLRSSSHDEDLLAFAESRGDDDDFADLETSIAFGRRPDAPPAR